jgi:DNA-binding transcriptional ArsR family regulator
VTATAAGDDLSLTFAALADPTRRAILTRLAAGEATVGQLAEPFSLTQQAVSKHIKVLERAGLVSRTRAAQSRPCRLEPIRFDTAAEWIDRHRKMWEDRYDRLDAHLSALAASEGETGDRSETASEGEAGYRSEDAGAWEAAGAREAADQREEAT